MESLSEGLTQKSMLNAIGFDQIQDGPEGSRIPETLRHLDVLDGQICIMQHQDSGDLAVPPEVGRHGHMQLCRIQVRQLIKAQSGLMTVNSFGYLIPILRPKRPLHQVGMFASGK